MRRSVLLLALLLQACDAPEPPAKQQGGLMQLSIKPAAGILRVARTSASAADILGSRKPTPGLPSFAFRMDYTGPKAWLEISYEIWHQGKNLGSSESHESIRVPVSDDAAFGFSEGKDGQKISVIAAHGSGSSALEFDLPSMRGRAIHTHEPSWPVEIPDGKDAVLWAVFVDEPADVPAGATPEERAKRADTGFLFRIRTADPPK